MGKKVRKNKSIVKLKSDNYPIPDIYYDRACQFIIIEVHTTYIYKYYKFLKNVNTFLSSPTPHPIIIQWFLSLRALTWQTLQKYLWNGQGKLTNHIDHTSTRMDSSIYQLPTQIRALNRQKSNRTERTR